MLRSHRVRFFRLFFLNKDVRRHPHQSHAYQKREKTSSIVTNATLLRFSPDHVEHQHQLLDVLLREICVNLSIL